MKLLIVDDEVFAIQGILDGVDWDRAGFEQVLTANSYAQAVNLFLEHAIDLLVCDIEMPYGSGLELVEWVRQHFPATAVIFLTCHDEFSFAQQAIKLKCMDYILKPVPGERMTELLVKVRTMLEVQRREEAYREYGKTYVQTLAGGKEQRDEKNDPLAVVEAHIKENLSEALVVEDLAKLVYLSPDHLTRLFKKKHNKTLIDYITQQRMFLAKELLDSGIMSIGMVAASVGYPNYSYFTKQFKRHYGITPREYRHRKSETGM